MQETRSYFIARVACETQAWHGSHCSARLEGEGEAWTSLTPCDGFFELQFCSSLCYSACVISSLFYPHHLMLQMQRRVLMRLQPLLMLLRSSAQAGDMQRSTDAQRYSFPRYLQPTATRSPQLAKSRQRHKTQAGPHILLDSHNTQP